VKKEVKGYYLISDVCHKTTSGEIHCALWEQSLWRKIYS